MKRLIAGAVAFAFAGAGSLALAAPPLGAQEGGGEEITWDFSDLAWGQGVELHWLSAKLEPESGTAGDPVTFTWDDAANPDTGLTGECNLARMSDPAHDHQVLWALTEADNFPGFDALPDEESITFTALQNGAVDVVETEEGVFDWEVTLNTPVDAGEYKLVGVCAPIDQAAYDHCDIGFYEIDLTVEEEEVETPPTTAPPTTTVPEEEEEVTPPAVAVPGQPEFTG